LSWLALQLKSGFYYLKIVVSATSKRDFAAIFAYRKKAVISLIIANCKKQIDCYPFSGGAQAGFSGVLKFPG
jgi:hypothetical protein